MGESPGGKRGPRKLVHVLQAQEQYMPGRNKAGKSGRRLVWVNKVLLDLLGRKKESL